MALSSAASPLGFRGQPGPRSMRSFTTSSAGTSASTSAPTRAPVINSEVNTIRVVFARSFQRSNTSAAASASAISSASTARRLARFRVVVEPRAREVVLRRVHSASGFEGRCLRFEANHFVNCLSGRWKPFTSVPRPNPSAEPACRSSLRSWSVRRPRSSRSAAVAIPSSASARRTCISSVFFVISPQSSDAIHSGTSGRSAILWRSYVFTPPTSSSNSRSNSAAMRTAMSWCGVPVERSFLLRVRGSRRRHSQFPLRGSL